MAQIFVSGTWNTDKAARWQGEAAALGRHLASEGFDLACGPGTGIARHVIDGYRQVESRGRVRYYLPAAHHMVAVGESVEFGADETEQTDLDYPMRNVWQVKKSDGLFLITGGDGTLEEALPALIDYNLPVGVIEESGNAARALKALVPIFPDWKANLIFGTTVNDIVTEFCDRVKQRSMKNDSNAQIDQIGVS